jgi:hypothetical protein
VETERLSATALAQADEAERAFRAGEPQPKLEFPTI